MKKKKAQPVEEEKSPYQEAIELYGRYSDEAIILSGDTEAITRRLEYRRKRRTYWNRELDKMDFKVYKGAKAYIKECKKMAAQEDAQIKLLEEALNEDAWLNT